MRQRNRNHDQEVLARSFEPRVARPVHLAMTRAVLERVVAMSERLERAAAFVAQLHRLSIRSPQSWRRAESVGSDIGYCKGRMV